MIRSVKNTQKIYLEGKRETYFFKQILKITGNEKKFPIRNLSGSSHENMIRNVISDMFIGAKILIIDNSNRTKGKIPLLENNEELLKRMKENSIYCIISKNQFDDEIIDFIDIPKISNKNSKESIEQYLKNNGLVWVDFLKNKIKDKKYLKDNISKIKCKTLKNLLSKILDSHNDDIYE